MRVKLSEKDVLAVNARLTHTATAPASAVVTTLPLETSGVFKLLDSTLGEAGLAALSSVQGAPGGALPGAIGGLALSSLEFVRAVRNKDVGGFAMATVHGVVSVVQLGASVGLISQHTAFGRVLTVAAEKIDMALTLNSQTKPADSFVSPPAWASIAARR